MTAHEEAMRELDEIEWVAGLRPMPDHLVELGTRTYTYIRRVVLDEPVVVGPISEDARMPTRVIAHHLEPLPRPIRETYVWGVLVERREL